MAKAWLNRIIVPTSLMACALGLSACGGANNPGGRIAPGANVAPGEPILGANVPADANTLTIAMKYVALTPDANTAATPTQAEVQTLADKMSQVWSQCGIRFVLDQYISRVASQDNVLYSPANQSDLDAMRSAYDDKKHALYVRTGKWDRSGDLGNDGSNGFSTMPPTSPEGTVFEEAVQTNPLLLAHETGHFLGGLDHTTDSTNLMDHFVSPSSTQLTSEQCNTARTTIQQYHQAWTR